MSGMICCLFLQPWLQKIIGWRQHMTRYFLLSWEGWEGGIYFLQICPWWCFQLTSWRHPMLQTRRSSCVEVKTFLYHTSASTQSSPCCRETSVWQLVNYHWPGRWYSRCIFEQRVGYFCTSFVLVHHRQSYCHAHQRALSNFLQGRPHIHWIIGSWILAIRLYPFNHMVCAGISSSVGYYVGDIGSDTWLGAQL